MNENMKNAGNTGNTGAFREIERELADSGMYVTVTEGDSMFPMLVTGTKVIIEKATFPLHKYDVPVYRKRGYTMHRIVKVKKDGSYIICGDNRVHLEKNIGEKDIVGKLVAFYRDGKLIEAGSKEFLAYGKRAVRGYPKRVLKDLARRASRKLGIGKSK